MVTEYQHGHNKVVKPTLPSVKLDDPSFPAPIYATLAEVEGEDGLQLIWSRSNRD